MFGENAHWKYTSEPLHRTFVFSRRFEPTSLECVLLGKVNKMTPSLSTRSLPEIRFGAQKYPDNYMRIELSAQLYQIEENEVEDTTAAVRMVDKYGGKDTPRQACIYRYIAWCGISEEVK